MFIYFASMLKAMLLDGAGNRILFLCRVHLNTGAVFVSAEIPFLKSGQFTSLLCGFVLYFSMMLWPYGVDVGEELAHL